jgi:hypothetical protein
MTRVSAVSGFDAGYVWRNQGRGGEKSAGGYYMSAAQQGEAPGRWFGKGAEHLGFADGQVVERAPYDRVYAQRHPETGELMGRRPANYRLKADIRARMLEAEPHATAERLREIDREAAQQTRKSPLYTDMTVSHNKSVSVLHAAFREQARRAGLAGDTAAQSLWQAREARVQEIEQQANYAGLVYMQEHGGFTRTGYHGQRIDGREAGKYERALPVVTTWLQATNRDGEPHDHSHNLWARMAITESDGKTRALDTMSLRQHLGGTQAVVDASIRSGLTQEFGVQWRPRADGLGYEIAGIDDAVIDAYSTRSVSVTREAAVLAEKWAQRFGRSPNAREMIFLGHEARDNTRQGKAEGVIDWDALTAKWDASLGGDLAAIADKVCDFGERGAASAAPSAEARERAISAALDRLDAEHATWGESALLKALSWTMGAEFDGMAPTERIDLMTSLAHQALTEHRFGVRCLEAPEWPPPPASLVRELDGRSIYTRPGTVRYATERELSLEERLVTQAQREGAPCLTRDLAAWLLGADADALETQLGQAAQDATRMTQKGLRYDQAAMIFEALTSPRRVSVGVGPAGAGKTWTVAAGARAWEAAGGDVIGITASQAAANVLRSAGIGRSVNSAKFLGQREGKPDGQPMPVDPGTLLVVDEGSAMSMGHLARIVHWAESCGAKVLVIGDHRQLGAVGAGGAMPMLADKLGYTQLSVPVRFAEPWEGDASLRLRRGDKTALDDYDLHGRIAGGDRVSMMAAARQAYLAGRLASEDVLLMAYSRDDCHELSRHIRDDLVYLGLVDGGRSVRIADQARASAGDLIVCHKNANRVVTDGTHTLSNGDIFKVEAVEGRGARLRRLLEADPETGAPRFSTTSFVANFMGRFDLAYAVTGHKGQGSTVARGEALITGSEPGEWLYVAMTRGRLGNIARVITRARRSDPAAGTVPDPELSRYKRLTAERSGEPMPAEPEVPEAHVPEVHKLHGTGAWTVAALAARFGVSEAEIQRTLDGDTRDPLAVLADCMEREDGEVAATVYAQRALSNADHLAVLNARYQDLAGEAEREHYHGLLNRAVGYEVEPGPTAPWLWRTLRSAELSGLDAGDVLHSAVAQSSLVGARDIAAVVDARIRHRLGGMTPEPNVRPWSERVPTHPDLEKNAYLHQVAAAMDARAERIGEHAAETSAEWATVHLGAVPDDPVARLDWQGRAKRIGTYLQLYGREGDGIGPEPAGTSPDQRAYWHDAQAAITRTDVADMKQMPESSLWHMRRTYETETAWAPVHVGRELRAARLAAADSRISAIRERGEAAATGLVSPGMAGLIDSNKHEARAAELESQERQYRDQESILAATHEDYQTWERLTEGARYLAVRAHAELVHRHPDMHIPPLRSAEPQVAEGEDVMARLPADRERFAEKAAERQGVLVPAEDPDYENEGEAWSLTVRRSDAALVPPPPELPPAAGVLEAALRQRDGQIER